MAILKVPRITTEQRLNIILQEAEIVYDTELKLYFGGDSETEGGFPIGNGSDATESYVEVLTINQDNIDTKTITLQDEITSPSKTKFSFINGTTQLLGIDYEFVDTFTIGWNGLGLDNFIEVSDVVLIEYW
jgi:hypothetical protein